jgi:hypothetical protein
MEKVYFFICITWVVGCTNDERMPSISQQVAKGFVAGVWIESINRTDTLDFDRLAPTSFMFGRGTEVIDGIKKHKSGIGFYRYHIRNNRISLQWCFSSIISDEEYYFKLMSDTIIMENFYDKDLIGSREIFVKLKKSVNTVE